MSLPHIAEEICLAMKMLYVKGLITPLAGNISVRLDDRILVTPSAYLKYALRPEDLVEVDMSGRVLRGGRPTSELPMHLEIYHVCRECRAVVHIHGIYAPMLRKNDVNELFIDAELEYVLKPRVCFIEIKPPGTRELAEAVASSVSEGCNAVVLERHGVVTVGSNLRIALELAEVIEIAARRMFVSRCIEKK